MIVRTIALPSARAIIVSKPIHVRKGSKKSIPLLYEEKERRPLDKALVKALARAYLWKKELQEGKYLTRMEVARAARLCPKYVYAIYELNRLSPRIKQAILEGTQPKELKLADMMKEIPILFEEQERKYGFVREAGEEVESQRDRK